MSSDHDAYRALASLFITALEEAAAGDGEHLVLMLERRAVADLISLVRHAAIVPYADVDVVLHQKRVNALLRRGREIAADFPNGADRGSLAGRLIALAGDTMEALREGAMIATQRDASLAHIARNWGTALDEALAENASKAATIARRALAALSDDDLLEIRRHVAAALCLTTSHLEIPHAEEAHLQ